MAKLKCEMCDEPVSVYAVGRQTGVVLCYVCRVVIGKKRKEAGIPIWSSSDLDQGEHNKTHELDN